MCNGPTQWALVAAAEAVIGIYRTEEELEYVKEEENVRDPAILKAKR